MSRTTLHQIALSLNISVTTVSKALRDYPDVSKKTKERVKAAVKEFNYKPNAFAVNLRTQESKTIGLIIPEIVHQFFSNVVKGVIEVAEKQGYMVIVLQTNQNFETEKDRLDFLINKQVDGVIIALADQTQNYAHFYEVLSLDTPIVMFDKITKEVTCSKVIIDDVKAGYEATRHLIETGCQHIAHFRGPFLSQNSTERFLGYKKALKEHDLEFKESNVYQCTKMIYEEGVENARKLLQNKNKVDGIFINTDLVAVGAIKEFVSQGVDIPNDISIIGFGNWFLSSIVTPSLTTVDQPSYTMGKIAFNKLFDEMSNRKNNQHTELETIILDTHIIERASTRPKK